MDNSSHSRVQTLSDDALVQAVHDSYSAIAKSGTDAYYANRVAHAFGYTMEQLQSIPDESHMGLSCGNPVAAASIKEGETVLDLGSGGGIDVLLASARAGPRGQVIGLDMSSNMISLARRNALKKGLKPPQVAFVQATLTDPLPITSNSIDCILSNCVINLLPLSGKANLLKETHRVLKPGGRIVLDDIIAKKPLPEDIRNNLAALVGCIAGAIEIEMYKNILTNAGFQDVVFVDTRGDMGIYFKDDSTFAGCCTPMIDTSATQPCCTPKTDTTTTQSCCPPKTATTTTQPCCPPKTDTTTTQPCCSPKTDTTTTRPCCTPKADTTATQRNGGCCGEPASKTAPVSSLKDFDANSWVASYQIYAVKSSVTTADSKAIPEPLLHWWDAYPTPTSSPAVMSADDLSSLLLDPSRRDECAVIDVRGSDHVGGHVKGSSQYPAQAFYSGLVQFAKRFGDSKEVVFYCTNSNGRAPRCAGWYLDYLNQVSRSSPKVYVLQGGITSWLAKDGNDKQLVDYE